MPKGVPNPAMKTRVRELYENGFTPKNIARETGISPSTIKKWVIALPKHSTGTTSRRHGYAALRVARLTGREGDVIRDEMEAKDDNPCFFCGSGDYDAKGWFRKVYHHGDDGIVERAHSACNAVRRHATRL